MTLRCGECSYPKTNYKATRYLIAYLDILGVTQIIYNDDDFSFLNHLNMFMEDAISEAGGGVFKNKEEIFVKIFSDNIILAIELKEIDEQRDSKIAVLFNIVANIYNEILRYGYLMRGAIVEGEFFHNKIIVYGKGLVEAVQLEEEKAKVPRILVRIKVSEPHSYFYLMQDNDNELFLNVFQICDAFDYVTFKYNLLEMLKKYKNDESVKLKIMWTINYYNTSFQNSIFYSLERPRITKEEINEAIQD